jgi:hypothetical protein
MVGCIEITAVNWMAFLLAVLVVVVVKTSYTNQSQSHI